MRENSSARGAHTQYSPKTRVTLRIKNEALISVGPSGVYSYIYNIYYCICLGEEQLTCANKFWPNKKIKNKKMCVCAVAEITHTHAWICLLAQRWICTSGYK